MTTISDIADIARILREQPEWADTIRGLLLDQQLLGLPSQFAEFIEVTRESNRLINERLEAFRAETNTRLARLEAEQAETSARLEAFRADTTMRLERLEAAQAETNERLDALRRDTNERLDALRRDTNERLEALRKEVNEQLEAFRKELDERLEAFRKELNGRLDDLHRESNERLEAFRIDTNIRLNSIEGRLSNFEGRDYERRVRYRVLARVQERYGLNGAYLAMSQSDPRSVQLSTAIIAALQSGSLSSDQSEDLGNTDIIISDLDNRHVVIEVSIAASQEDIVRAKRRAQIVSDITSGTAIPMIVAAIVNDSQGYQAHTAAVEVITIPY